MNSYEFELIFKVDNSNENLLDYSDKLYEAGCDDALVSVGQLGMIALSFTREAENAHIAIDSAIKNVRTAIPHAELIEASPDFVSITDVASILGHSRQYTRKLFNKKSGLPLPIHMGSPTIWHLSEVLNWIKKITKNGINLSDSLLEVSSTTRQVNFKKQMEHLQVS
jgi:predicted DNA-binding transcriptional regulator AlpA